MQTLTTNLINPEISAYRNYQGGFFKVLISPEETQGNFALIDMTLPQGVEPPVHLHSREDETFYLLEGEITFYVGEKVTKLKTGESIFAPRQVPHHFKINTPSARFLSLITPGNFLEYFMQFSFPAAEEVQVIPPQGPPPSEHIAFMMSELNQKYGVLFI
ncbi:cupin domain-containing protein [Adhaeribacter radiodurans]|uniref:Cupin domain-containing protein n=1 Tax=Adhaeribacter radiodurans TaxID=2745197 RepID=A0A7L7L6B4_9BACT|nr:cupin domain-containing protein [Adhaeribacter radiodurans]QMU28340.1 cupin domain-containing protein [Adhaeribacter radiodurans]